MTQEKFAAKHAKSGVLARAKFLSFDLLYLNYQIKFE